jgi:hypothetical protein
MLSEIFKVNIGELAIEIVNLYSLSDEILDE